MKPPTRASTSNLPSLLAGGPRQRGWRTARPAVPDRVAVRLVALLMIAGAISAEANADWPLVRGDASATGAVAESIPRPLEILWTYEIDSGFDATAAIVDGVVYVGDVDGTYHAVRLDTGKASWTKKFEDSGFIAGSAVVDGRILCVDFNGIVRCLDAADGKELWKLETGSSLYAAPNVYESRVLIVTDSGDLLALDAATGEERGKFSIDQPLRCWPTVVGGRVLVAGCDGVMHAIDAATLKEVASVDIGGPADGMPAVVGDRVYFCTAGGVFHALNVKDLTSAWKFGHRGQGETIHAAAVNDRAVVLGTHDKRMVALDPSDGKELWVLPLKSRAESSPVIAGDLALFGTVRGRLQAADMKSGKEVWHQEVGGRFTASPALGDGRLVIGNEDGTLYCIGQKP